MNKLNLLAPGPVPMPPEVYSAISEPMSHHRTPEFSDLLNKCYIQLKTIFQTKQDVLIHTATGSGSLESAVVNTLKYSDEVLVIVSGKFGERWRDICASYKLKKVHEIQVEWGQAVTQKQVADYLSSNPQINAVLTQYCETSTGVLHPLKEIAQLINEKYPNTLLLVDAITAIGAVDLKMDDWGIDVVCAGSQKAFMMPTGLSFIALSDKAWKACEESDLPKYYFNLKNELKALKKNQTFFSSSIMQVRALNAYFNYLNKKGGLSFSIARCLELAQATRVAIKALKLEIYSDSPSPSLTAIKLPSHIDGKELRLHLENKYKVIFMGGQEALAGKIIRIGHLGYVTNDNLVAGVQALGDALLEYKHEINQKNIQVAIKNCRSSLKEDM